MSEAAVLEPEAALQHPAPAALETPAPVIPQPTVAEMLEQHLPHDQQKKIAVDNLSSIKFIVAPDGKSAISAKPLPSDKHREIVEASLTAILGVRPEDASYLPAPEGMVSALGLASGSNFVELHGAGTIKRLAEAGVKDFADALDISRSSHAARVR